VGASIPLLTIHTGALGNMLGSPNHAFCMSWLAGKDAEAREAREERMVAIAESSASAARHAAWAAYIAAAMAAVSIALAVLFRE
jgi:formate/nitrite transporter FocA (FNT family)